MRSAIKYGTLMSASSGPSADDSTRDCGLIMQKVLLVVRTRQCYIVRT
jgi:hypothetical protein